MPRTSEPKQPKQPKSAAKAKPAKPKPAVPKPETPDTPGNGTHPAAAPRYLLVGIGTSAGGLEPLTVLLQNLESDDCCSYFIVQHQSPRSEPGTLPDLLARHSGCPVRKAEDGVKVKPGEIYVAPPAMLMGVREGRITVEAGHDHKMAIDHMLRSLAQEAKERTVAVVLSGSNTDGTLGARAVREAGGMVFAQDPRTTQYATMPQSVIDEGLADLVLPPEAMPAQMLAYADKLASLPDGSSGKRDEFLEIETNKLLQLLWKITGQDFTKYKPSTVHRRIRRRMDIHQIDRIQDYISFLRSNTEEAQALFKDLLIGVTNFFRDPEAFLRLKELFKEYLRRQEKLPSVRAWVCGCATGEEAYSLAILVSELADELKIKTRVEIYATDLDAGAIERARAGLFPLNIEADVSTERLQRFFTRSESGYRVKGELREMLVFAVQNVIQDPPFSRLDLIVCRNLLMYLKPEAQRRAMTHFRFALKPGGLLFLGTSESVTSMPESFLEVEKKWRIFQRKATGEPSRGLGITELPVVARDWQPHPLPEQSYHPQITGIKHAAQAAILSTCCPAALLVNKSGDILYIHGRTGAYLEPSQGEPELNALKMAREGLRIDLSTVLSAAANKQAPQKRGMVKVKTNGHELYVEVSVAPVRLKDMEETLYIVSFRDQNEPSGVTDQPPESAQEQLAHTRIRELEEELQENRESMQSIIEEYEAANEELKSSNEELQSTNEELKSTNEELETAKEELQSINEEQITLNAELQSKNEELRHISDDMANLFSSTNLATLFLDNELRIKRFTPAIQQFMSLRESDVGRPASEITLSLHYGDFLKDVKQVTKSLNSVSREVSGQDATWYQVGIRPYRTLDNVIDGTVVTFSDITEVKRKQLEARETLLFVESMIDTIREPLLVLDRKLTVQSANRSFYETFLVDERETEGRRLYDLGNGQWDIPALRELLDKVLPEQSEVRDYEVEHDFPSIGATRLRLNARSIPTAGEGRILLAITRIESAAK